MAKPRGKHWFWAWIVLATVQKSRQNDSGAQCEVWENLVILHASTPRDALQKAERIGRSEAGDSRGSLRLGAEPATCKFMGIASLGVIHDGLVDGAEITWRLKRCRQSTAAKLPKAAATLLAEAEEELRHVERAAAHAI